jgi:stalled ribosome alternative rescue factor ArfA
MARPVNLAARKLSTPECRPKTFRVLKGKGSYNRKGHLKEKIRGALSAILGKFSLRNTP